MSVIIPASEKQHLEASITVDQAEAARLTNLSAKTLERLAAAGEPVGRLKIGRRVLYLRAALEQFLISQSSTNYSGRV